MDKCSSVGSGTRVAVVVKRVFMYSVTRLIGYAVVATAAILLLIPIVRWIGEPDYITPHRRAERKIDEFVEGLLR